MTQDERSYEVATLAINSAVEVVDLLAAGGPCVDAALIQVLARMATSIHQARDERKADVRADELTLGALNRGEPRREVFVVLDRKRVAGRPWHGTDER